MSALRIAVLNASHRDENTTRNFRRELEGSIAEFDVTAGDLPATFGYDAVVVTGSRSSVYWDEPWIAQTRAWASKAVDREIPALGICWGHQLLADVLGGTVEEMGVYEVGYSEIEHTGDSRLFTGVDRQFLAFTTHSDAVVELPPGADPLAENEYSNHGFRADHVFGVQFHPEFDVETARRLVERKPLSEERRAAVLEEITAENYARAGEAKLVFENFLAYVRERRDRATDAVETGTPPTDESIESAGASVAANATGDASTEPSDASD